MREIKSGVVNSEDQRDIVALQHSPSHQGLVKANRVLLLFASSLMVLVFILGFLLIPSGNALDHYNPDSKSVSDEINTSEKSALFSEISTLKGQFVGLISGSIESKLKVLESHLKRGAMTSSLSTLQDIKSDVQFLQAYSIPPVDKKDKVKTIQSNSALLDEVAELKRLIYFTLTSCGLMISALCGFWFKRYDQLSHAKAMLNHSVKHKE